MAFIFPYIGNFIIPTDELIFFRGVGQPPTSWVCLKQATRLALNLMVKDLVSPLKWPQLGGRGPILLALIWCFGVRAMAVDEVRSAWRACDVSPNEPVAFMG